MAVVMKDLEKINRELYEPSYAQLARILRTQIARGHMRPGDRLPSESQLCRQYDISPMTVRRAINILSDEGVVVTSQGKGTFVKSIQFWDATFRLDRLQPLIEDEEKAKVKLLETRIRKADSHVALKLGVKIGQRVIYICRLLLLQEKPFLYHREYLIYDPKRPIVESEIETTSLKGLFEGTGRSLLKSSALNIEVTVLTKEEAAILESNGAAPAFRIEHIFYDFNNHPISWGWLVCPGNLLRFTTSVGFHHEEL